MSVFDDELDIVQTPLASDTEGEGATPDTGIVPTPEAGAEENRNATDLPEDVWEDEPQEEEVFTIEKYLQGKVRTKISEDALMSILADAEVKPKTPFEELTKKEKDLATAYLYAWAATAPSTSSRIKDADGNWSHEEGSETFDASARRHFLILANDLFKKYNLATIGSSSWGVSGRGFGHIRNYGKLY